MTRNRPMRSLAIALLLSCGACIKTTDGGTPDKAWTPVGDGLYRLDDRERGVTCYLSTTNGILSCVRSDLPPVTPEADDAK